MTKEILKEIRARCDSATAGPWKDGYGDGSGKHDPEDGIGCITAGIENSETSIFHGKLFDCADNATFIAHSREDLPKLLDALEVGINALEDITEHTIVGIIRVEAGKRNNLDSTRLDNIVREALAAIDRILAGNK